MDTTGTLVPHSLRWYAVWKEVLLHPSENTFNRILSDPTASPKRVYLWIAVLGALTGIYVSTRPAVFNLGRMVKFMIAGPILLILVLVIESLILHWSSNLLGGQGIYDHWVYAFGAIYAPAYLINSIFNTLFSSYVPLGLLVQLVIILYTIYVVIQALKAVAKLNTGKAIMALIFPLLLFGGLVSCIIFLWPI